MKCERGVIYPGFNHGFNTHVRRIFDYGTVNAGVMRGAVFTVQVLAIIDPLTLSPYPPSLLSTVNAKRECTGYGIRYKKLLGTVFTPSVDKHLR